MANRQNPELNLNINLLHALMRPGDRLSTRAIGDICGVSGMAILEIERIALRKVREAIRRQHQLTHGELAQLKPHDFL